MPKIAIVHDWLTGYRGGEKCLTHFLQIYPTADIFTLIHIPGSTTKEIDSRVVQTSFFQKIPFADTKYRYLLPLFPAAVKSLDLTGYDLIISLSHAVAKNVTVPKGAKHLCYCFTPMRYIWDQAEEYLGKFSKPAWPLVKYLRNWDLQGSKTVDQFVPISRFVAARIRKFYQRRDSIVVYPPTDVSWIERAKQNERGEAFLSFGAMVPYKRVDHAIIACKNLGVKLWVAGDGPDRKRLEQLRDGDKNIEFLGKISDQELSSLYRKCRALLFPGTEDFGLIPIECLASGRPVIANYSGAVKETLCGISGENWANVSGKHKSILKTSTGVFYRGKGNNKLNCLSDAITCFIDNEDKFVSDECVSVANLFSPERFRAGWLDVEKRI